MNYRDEEMAKKNVQKEMTYQNIEEKIIEKIHNKDYDSFTIDEHYYLGGIVSESQIFDFTKRIWTYLRFHGKWYWAKEYTALLLNWNKNMIDYYLHSKRAILVRKKKIPKTIRFTYQIIYVDLENDVSALKKKIAYGKFTHGHTEISPELWKTIKKRLKEQIHKVTINSHSEEMEIRSIDIFNINDKNNAYESDDVYAFHCDENRPDDESEDEIINMPMEKPKVPNELLGRYSYNTYQ